LHVGISFLRDVLVKSAKIERLRYTFQLKGHGVFKIINNQVVTFIKYLKENISSGRSKNESTEFGRKAC
jgi:hypothetical protein